MRRLLTTELSDEAAAYGLGAPSGDRWQETCIWCPSCGQRRLLGRFSKGEDDGAFMLRCPDPSCYQDGGPEVFFVRSIFADFPHTVSLLRDVRGFKPALTRVMAHTHSYYEPARANGAAPCMRCGHLTELQRCLPSQQRLTGRRGVHLLCDRCGCLPDEPLRNLVLSLPAGRRFWREHPRIRTLPERELEAEGRPALLVTFESVRDSSRFDVVVDRETYRVIRNG